MATASDSAAARVFGITELLIQIIKQLNSNEPEPLNLQYAKEIFALQHVNRKTYEIIAGSLKLRRAMLLEHQDPANIGRPNPADGGTIITCPTRGNHLTPLFPGIVFSPYESGSNHIFQDTPARMKRDQLHIDLDAVIKRKSNPLLRIGMSRSKAPKLHDGKQCSWRATKLSLHPVEVEVWVVVHVEPKSVRMGPYTAMFTFRKESNATIGQLVDLMKHFCCRELLEHTERATVQDYEGVETLPVQSAEEFLAQKSTKDFSFLRDMVTMKDCSCE